MTRSPIEPDGVIEMALASAKHGWRLFPLFGVHVEGGLRVCECARGAECQDTGKHPRIKNWQNRASTNPILIKRWFRRWPTANVAIATGSASGLVAIDIDAKHDGDVALSILEDRYGTLPPTIESHTGGGGRHLF